MLMETKPLRYGKATLYKDGKEEVVELSPFNLRENWVDMVAYVFDKGEADYAVVQWRGHIYRYRNVDGVMEKEK